MLARDCAKTAAIMPGPPIFVATGAKICFSRTMSWWGSRKPADLLDREPVAVVDRVEETQRRVRQLKAELDSLDSEMLAFKTKNKIRTDRFGRLLGVECATLNGRASIETQWRVLLRRRDSLVSAWHKSLHEWAAAKQEVK
jgi:hypothetical protein